MVVHIDHHLPKLLGKPTSRQSHIAVQARKQPGMFGLLAYHFFALKKKLIIFQSLIIVFDAELDLAGLGPVPHENKLI